MHTCTCVRMRVSSEITEEICSAESFVASCSDNETILIRRADYGHMRQGRCIDQDSGRFGCQKDVTRILHRFDVKTASQFLTQNSYS